MRKEAIESKKRILQSTIEILKKKPYNKVTIKDICLHANISRQTFYSHYSNKDDIFKSFYMDMFQYLCASKMTNLSYFFQINLLKVSLIFMMNGQICSMYLICGTY